MKKTPENTIMEYSQEFLFPLPESDNHSIQLLHCKCGINPAAKCYPYCQQCGKRHVNSTSCCQGYNRASAEQRTGSNCHTLEIVALGTLTPLTLTASVMVVATAAVKAVE